MKRRPLQQSPLQLSLFELEYPPAPAPKNDDACADLPPASPGITEKTAAKRRVLPGIHAIEYSLHRSRRRSIGFLIEDDGLRVTAPRWVTIAEIEDAIRSKLRWIMRKLDELQERLSQRQSNAIEWRDGGRIVYLGKQLVLRLDATGGPGEAVLDDEAGTLTLALTPETPEENLKQRILRWLQDQAQDLFAKRLRHYAEKLGITYRSFALSAAITQWGSCTAQGRIRLNWRLIHLPLPLIDYVVAHELSHLSEMNHGPRFWAKVESAFPEYRTAREMLRNHSPGAMPSS